MPTTENESEIVLVCFSNAILAYMLISFHESNAVLANSVLARRPYITEAMCREVIARPTQRETQPDGRIRHYGYVESLDKWIAGRW